MIMSSTQQIIRTSELSVLDRKGTPRIWMEGLYLKLAGFEKGCSIKVTFDENKMQILKVDDGTRIVSAKKDTPVIDINNQEILKSFQIGHKIRAIVKHGLILLTKTKKQRRLESQLSDKSCASIFSGGGLLDQAAIEAGYTPKWGVELDAKYADIWQQNHSGSMHNLDISDVEIDDLQRVEMITAGIPCPPFSVARQNQKGEFHKDTDLSLFFMMIIEKINPRTIVLEEVPGYLKSEIGQATIQGLERMGYNVSYEIISGQDYGELELRKRAVIVATTNEQFVFPEKISKERTMGEILESPDHEDCQWFSRKEKAWFFERWDVADKKGTNFKSQIITNESTKIQAITRRYFAIQAGNPVIEHPTREGYYRLLTLTERRKLATLAEDYYLGPKTTAGEVMGQGIIVSVFQKIIEAVGIQV
jgi:DNA (cytosine-5)-methyltransferase 1